MAGSCDTPCYITVLIWGNVPASSGVGEPAQLDKRHATAASWLDLIIWRTLNRENRQTRQCANESGGMTQKSERG